MALHELPGGLRRGEILRRGARGGGRAGAAARSQRKRVGPGTSAQEGPHTGHGTGQPWAGAHHEAVAADPVPVLHELDVPLGYAHLDGQGDGRALHGPLQAEPPQANGGRVAPDLPPLDAVSARQGLPAVPLPLVAPAGVPVSAAAAAAAPAPAAAAALPAGPVALPVPHLPVTVSAAAAAAVVPRGLPGPLSAPLVPVPVPVAAPVAVSVAGRAPVQAGARGEKAAATGAKEHRRRVPQGAWAQDAPVPSPGAVIAVRRPRGTASSVLGERTLPR